MKLKIFYCKAYGSADIVTIESAVNDWLDDNDVRIHHCSVTRVEYAITVSVWYEVVKKYDDDGRDLDEKLYTKKRDATDAEIQAVRDAEAAPKTHTKIIVGERHLFDAVEPGSKECSLCEFGLHDDIHCVGPLPESVDAAIEPHAYVSSPDTEHCFDCGYPQSDAVHDVPPAPEPVGDDWHLFAPDDSDVPVCTNCGMRRENGMHSDNDRDLDKPELTP